MTAEDKIDPLGQSRGIRIIKEGSVFAKFRTKRKIKTKKEQTEEETAREQKSSEHKIDIEA